MVVSLQVPDPIPHVQRPRIDLALEGRGVCASLISQANAPPVVQSRSELLEGGRRLVVNDVSHVLGDTERGTHLVDGAAQRRQVLPQHVGDRIHRQDQPERLVRRGTQRSAKLVGHRHNDPVPDQRDVEQIPAAEPREATEVEVAEVAPDHLGTDPEGLCGLIEGRAGTFDQPRHQREHASNIVGRAHDPSSETAVPWAASTARNPCST
jgi:hypothetical protein